METVTLILRLVLVVLGLTLLALSVGSLTRPGVGWPQRCRFLFIAGISAVVALRTGQVLIADEPAPLWALIAADVLFAIGVFGGAHFYREYPATRWPKPLPPRKGRT